MDKAQKKRSLSLPAMVASELLWVGKVRAEPQRGFPAAGEGPRGEGPEGHAPPSRLLDPRQLFPFLADHGHGPASPDLSRAGFGIKLSGPPLLAQEMWPRPRPGCGSGVNLIGVTIKCNVNVSKIQGQRSEGPAFSYLLSALQGSGQGPKSPR